MVKDAKIILHRARYKDHFSLEHHLDLLHLNPCLDKRRTDGPIGSVHTYIKNCGSPSKEWEVTPQSLAPRKLSFSWEHRRKNETRQESPGQAREPAVGTNDKTWSERKYVPIGFLQSLQLRFIIQEVEMKAELCRTCVTQNEEMRCDKEQALFHNRTRRIECTRRNTQTEQTVR